MLADPADGLYVLYANEASGALGVSGMTSGTYRLSWFDPVDGSTTEQVVEVKLSRKP